MGDQWHFMHGGKTRGPLSIERLNQLVSSGRLNAQDMVWPDGVETRITVQAYQSLQRRGKVADWLSRIRQVEAAAKPPEPAASALPDWLDDVRQIEESRTESREPAAASAPPVPAAPPRPPAPDQVRVDTNTPAPAVSGAKRTKVTTTSDVVYRAFVLARRAIKEWLNEERTRPLILAGDLEAIRRSPEVAAIFQEYHRYGRAMRERLSKHLDFFVASRRRRYLTSAGK